MNAVRLDGVLPDPPEFRVLDPLVPQPADIAHGDRGGDERQDRFARGGRDGQVGVVECVAVGDVERDGPPPLHARGLVVVDRHRIEVQHLDILRHAPLRGQVHLNVVDEHSEEEVVGVDRADHSAGELLHGVGEEHVVARLHQRVDLRGVDLGLVGAPFGTVHPLFGLFVDGRVLDHLHGRLLDGDHRGLRHAVGAGSAQRVLRRLCGDGAGGQQPRAQGTEERNFHIG